jgi:hypothetical protein
VYLANLNVWNGIGSSGLQVAPVPNRPGNRVDGDGKPIDYVVPTISLGQCHGRKFIGLYARLLTRYLRIPADALQKSLLEAGIGIDTQARPLFVDD